MKAIKRSNKSYWELTKSELARATREFDREFIADQARPMTAAEREEERRARRRGRPKVGLGSRKIHITVEKRLLKETDKLAKQRGLARSELIAEALAAMIAHKAS